MSKWVRGTFFGSEDIELLIGETNTTYLFEVSIHHRYSVPKDKCSFVDWEPKNGELCLFWNDQKDVHLGKFNKKEDGYYFAYYYDSKVVDDILYVDIQSSKHYKFCEPYVGFTPTIYKKEKE